MTDENELTPEEERLEAIDMILEAARTLERLGYPRQIYICGDKIIDLKPDENKIVIR